MKGVIIYKGKYGATEQYASWLGETLGLPILKAGDIEGEALKSYDFFVLGTSVYIGKLQLSKWLRRNEMFLTNKPVFLFQVAGTPTEEITKRQAYNAASVPDSILADCRSFFFPGKMIFRQLSWKDRWLLKMGARLAKDPDEKKNMLQDYDAVKRENIDVMVRAVQSILQKGAVVFPSMKDS